MVNKTDVECCSRINKVEVGEISFEIGSWTIQTTIDMNEECLACIYRSCIFNAYFFVKRKLIGSYMQL